MDLAIALAINHIIDEETDKEVIPEMLLGYTKIKIHSEYVNAKNRYKLTDYYEVRHTGNSKIFVKTIKLCYAALAPYYLLIELSNLSQTIRSHTTLNRTKLIHKVDNIKRFIKIPNIYIAAGDERTGKYGVSDCVKFVKGKTWRLKLFEDLPIFMTKDPRDQVTYFTLGSNVSPIYYYTATIDNMKLDTSSLKYLRHVDRLADKEGEAYSFTVDEEFDIFEAHFGSITYYIASTPDLEEADEYDIKNVVGLFEVEGFIIYDNHLCMLTVLIDIFN
jgi:hypothetical protein